jgi:hypothetical protein
MRQQHKDPTTPWPCRHGKKLLSNDPGGQDVAEIDTKNRVTRKKVKGKSNDLANDVVDSSIPPLSH